MNNMYSNGYVLTIISNGKILPELADASVLVPYNSEYKLRLRNKHGKRALARVWIDGEEVSKDATSDGLIIPANSFIDFERPLDAPVKFKFVARDTAEAAEAGKDGPDPRREMGVVRVEFTEEADLSVPTAGILHTSRKDWYHGPDWDRRYKGGLNPGSTFRIVSGKIKSCNMAPEASLTDNSRGISSTAMNFMATDEPMGMAMMATSTPIDDSGCTVEGSHSDQTFKVGSFVSSNNPATIIQVVLKGAPETEVEIKSSSLRKNRADKVRREQIAALEQSMAELQAQIDKLKAN